MYSSPQTHNFLFLYSIGLNLFEYMGLPILDLSYINLYVIHVIFVKLLPYAEIGASL